MDVASWCKSNLTPLNGMRVAVTGATGSLGACIARRLCALGASVWLIARDRERAEALKAELLLAHPQAEVRTAYCDFAGIESVSCMASSLCEELDHLDALVNVAGIFRQPRQLTADGLELTYQVNALCPMLLSRALLPLLQRSNMPKLIAMTSLSAYYTRVDRDDLTGLRVSDPTDRYARSKRLLTFYMERLALESGVCAIHVHPGVSATNLFSVEKAAYSARFLRVALPLMRRVFMPPDKASLCAAYACCHTLPSQSLVAPSGLMQAWGFPAAAALPAFLRSRENAQAIWEATETLLKEKQVAF